ncbi:MAG TPA: (2Fe-2S)-binding protein [Ramlibacter sp.]|nr:(2Fe-2S)-binding protein [Ramlibacter sp.]
MNMPIRVNGRSVSVKASPDTPLLWVLREELGLTGTKFGCGMGICGACTVHIGDAPARSCVTPVGGLVRQRVRTIESLGEDRIGKALQAAWIAVDVPQCGYCQSGQLMNAATLLRRTPRPTDEEINEAMNGNICRCGTYDRIRAAIHDAARALAA